MSRTIYQWVLPSSPNEEIVKTLSSKFNISVPLTKLLINRGYDTEDKIKSFIFSEIIYLDNPFLFSDMEKAISILKKHIELKNKILIWGDRDVDGVTSVVLLYNTLKNFGCEPFWYIPQNEGYGLNREVLQQYKDKIDLVITVDCGIAEFTELEYIKSLGKDVIVTDHHEPPEKIYEFKEKYDIPVLNPYLKNYPGFKDLAGVGVVLKFVWGLMLSFDEKFINRDFIVLDIETSGLSPMVHEICEIAAVKMRNFIPQEIFHTLVKPKKNITEEITKIHGITNEMISNAPYIEEILSDFLNFVKDTPLIIHNADFDLSFINYNLKSFGYNKLKNEVVDTLSLSREYFPLQSHSLTALCSEFMFKNIPKHRALDDVYATIELFYFLYYFKNTKIRFFIEDNLDLVALGTISDIMPLIKDNRTIVKKGLETLARTRKPPIRILMKHLLKKTNEITAENISWYITPLLNSAGRMQKVDVVVNFLLEEKPVEAERYFSQLLEINQSRKSLLEINLTKFYELIEQQCDIVYDLILVIVAENVEHGVTGVIANRIMNEFNRPVILLILDNDTATGAARAPKGVNIYEILKKLDYLYEKFGGHEQACGLTLHKDKIQIFKEEIKKVVKDKIVVQPILEIDTEISLDDITPQFVKELDILEPCGEENPYPIFLIKNVKIVDWKSVGSNKKYTKLILQSSSRRTNLEGIYWEEISEIEHLIKNFSYFDVVCEITLNHQKGNIPETIILDLQSVI